MSPEVHLELQRLLSALCDGALTEAQQVRLEQLLDADADCRRLYLEYLDMHARLLLHPGLCEVEEPFLAEEADPPRPAPSPVRARRRRPARQLLRYVLVAGATLAASFLVQVAWWHARGADGQRGSPSADKREPLPSDYVATLTQTADCAWEGQPLRSGARLLPGELKLRKGVAQIRFDTGPELLLEGPAELRLDSGTAATLLLGKVVLRTDETAPPFDLHTPSATLMDYGTEYAVAVNAEGEEVQVFEGEVQRVPREATDGAEAEHLKAGEARRSGRARAFPSQPAAFEPERFVRHLPAAPDRADGLMAYEGFDYAGAELFPAGKANGGAGWAGPWTVTFAGPPNAERRPTLNVKESLVRPASAVPSVGGRFEANGLALYYRRLAEPVRLDTEGVYYLSFLFRRQGPPAYHANTLAVMLRPDEEHQKRPDLSRRLTIGVGGPNQIYTHLGPACSRASLPLTNGVTYLLVAKIVAGKSTRKQIFVRVYGPREPIGGAEPACWTVVSPPFHSNLVLEWLGIHVNSMNRQMIDEIRVGTTWPSVTAAWRGAPEPGNDEGKP